MAVVYKRKHKDLMSSALVAIIGEKISERDRQFFIAQATHNLTILGGAIDPDLGQKIFDEDYAYDFVVAFTGFTADSARAALSDSDIFASNYERMSSIIGEMAAMKMKQADTEFYESLVAIANEIGENAEEYTPFVFKSAKVDPKKNQKSKR